MRRNRWDSGRRWDQGKQYFDSFIEDAKRFASNTADAVVSVARRIQSAIGFPRSSSASTPQKTATTGSAQRQTTDSGSDFSRKS
jgi:hypothetical protein